MYAKEEIFDSLVCGKKEITINMEWPPNGMPHEVVIFVQAHINEIWEKYNKDRGLNYGDVVDTNDFLVYMTSFNGKGEAT